MPGAEAGPPSGHPVRRVIGDSSTGTRIRATEPKPSETHNARGEDAQGQTVLAQQCSRYFLSVVQKRFPTPLLSSRPSHGLAKRRQQPLRMFHWARKLGQAGR